MVELVLALLPLYESREVFFCFLRTNYKIQK
nr:MAG TPA: hypothetical protein [Caudoviricetes sp.]